MTPATSWSEEISADEGERFERYAAELAALAARRARGATPDRALHAKGHAGLRAEFTVLADLPEIARVGLFAAPATFPAYVRFSNAAAARLADRKPDVRGVAVKLCGVPGRKLIPGLEEAKTQDFLLIRSPSTPFRNADEFVSFVRAARSPMLLLPRVLGHFGLRRGLGVVRRLLKGISVPVSSLATERFYSALPIRFGAYAVRYALGPQAQAEPSAARGRAPDSLGDELCDRLRRGPLVWDFRVQFYCDPVRTPIEDASADWSEADAPYVTIARLTLPQQDARSPTGRRLAQFVERLSFDPWHAQEELRPLGNMMRARNQAYRVSTAARKAAPEPDGSERFGG
jgi:hypothetical protein